jgi:hypothetical protein
MKRETACGSLDAHVTAAYKRPIMFVAFVTNLKVASQAMRWHGGETSRFV